MGEVQFKSQLSTKESNISNSAQINEVANPVQNKDHRLTVIDMELDLNAISINLPSELAHNVEFVSVVNIDTSMKQHAIWKRMARKKKDIDKGEVARERKWSKIRQASISTWSFNDEMEACSEGPSSKREMMINTNREQHENLKAAAGFQSC